MNKLTRAPNSQSNSFVLITTEFVVNLNLVVMVKPNIHVFLFFFLGSLSFFFFFFFCRSSPPRDSVLQDRLLRSNFVSITKTCLYNFDPLQPYFYIVKLGFKGVYIIFLISAQKHRLWVLVRTASARRF